ncbi:MAG: PqqD family protein [Candidatus Acidiferrales bacterium]
MFRIASTIRRTETEDGGILLDIHHGQMFCLNVVGSKIIELLERGLDEAQIADQISRAFAADIETVRAHVREFIEVLNQHHILQTRDAQRIV